MYEVHYEVHWARTNRADKLVAMRSGAQRHATPAEAAAEAATICPPRPDLVPVVVEVRRVAPRDEVLA